MPAEQLVQSRTDVGPVFNIYILLESAYVPAGHWDVHVTFRPNADEYVPGWHVMQPARAVAGSKPYVPAAH